MYMYTASFFYTSVFSPPQLGEVRSNGSDSSEPSEFLSIEWDDSVSIKLKFNGNKAREGKNVEEESIEIAEGKENERANT